MSDPHDLPEPDVELERLLADVNELAASVAPGQAQAGAEAFLDRVGALRARALPLLATRTPAELERRLRAYAEHRFDLVDAAEEYAHAAEELLMASLVLADAPEAIAMALQRGVLRLSAVLSEPGAARQFGRLLRRVRELGRASGDAELQAWVNGVVKALPE